MAANTPEPTRDLAQERLETLGLRIERLPGGHLTTNEQPEALATLIAEFERGLARKPSEQEACRHGRTHSTDAGASRVKFGLDRY
jgi:hypothetical protein